MRAARRGINAGAHSGPDDASFAVHEVPIQIGPVILVLLLDVKTARGRHSGGFARGNGRVDGDLVANH